MKTKVTPRHLARIVQEMAFESELQTLQAAKEKLAHEIRGLNAINNDPLPDETHAAIDTAVAARNNRWNLLDAVVRAINALVEDGYPTDLPKIELPSGQLTVIETDVSDVNIASGLFAPSTQASRISADLGQPADKPTP
jgi:hypothetical protein